ncbi:MAG: hypothetical protein OXU45_04300 [Candidatus Melainabacteria bacterium]|nr:hypothetical protein [Candidatus Melainabacteria bacterium]
MELKAGTLAALAAKLADDSKSFQGYKGAFVGKYGDSSSPVTITSTEPIDLNSGGYGVKLEGAYGGNIEVSLFKSSSDKFTTTESMREKMLEPELIGTGVETTGSVVVEDIDAVKGGTGLTMNGTDGKDTFVLSGDFDGYGDSKDNVIQVYAGKGGDTVYLDGISVSPAKGDDGEPIKPAAQLLQIDLGGTGHLIIDGDIDYEFVDLDGDGKAGPARVTTK